ncbi:MAG: alanine racemase [Chloroflexi bacterium]|nr:alanine racemase [Chloroflexota bacterium]
MPTLPRDNGVPKLDSMPWPAWLEVDLDAIEANVRAITASLRGGAGVLAVVKAQAYGLGAGPVAEAAVRAGAVGVAVARVAEGVQLRQRGLAAPILLMGPLGPGEEDEAVRWELTATLADVGSAARLAAAADRAGKIVPVHLKVDTGLTRFGARPEELLPLAAKVNSLAPLIAQGLYTHFASADEADLSYTYRQLERFQALRALLAEHDFTFELCHAANSAATLRCPEAHFDWARPGITLLGAYPAPAVPRLLDLRPAFQFKAQVARVYELPPGTSVGYGRTFHASAPVRAALVPTGYADGVPRAHSNRAQVLIHGQRAPLIGRVSMDQCVADVTNVPGVEPGDEVVLLGRQGDDEIDLDTFAADSDTIPHEALTRLGARVPRVYLQGGCPQWAAALNGEAWLELPERIALR